MSNQYRSVLASSGPAPTGGTAIASEVLSGKTFTNDNGLQTGTMPNRGAVSQTLEAGDSYTIPEGYHNGTGIVTASLPTEDILWTNDNPSSSFATQEVTLSDNLSNYRYVGISFNKSTSDTTKVFDVIAKVDQITQLTSSDATTNFVGVVVVGDNGSKFRRFVATDTTVNFYAVDGSNNNIPTKIYGIK